MSLIKKRNITKFWLILGIFLLLITPWPSELGQAEGFQSYAITRNYHQSDIYRKPVIKKAYSIKATAYTSTESQCDSTPFITASGTQVKDGIIAANCLPFGTKVRFPNLFRDKVFTVEDRLASRFGCLTVDIWFADYSKALEFGRIKTIIEIIE